MSRVFNPYKSFYIDDIKINTLGDLDKELGDELRAFKKNSIDFPSSIINAVNDYTESYINKFDALVYIPSNKNNGIMDFFADYISDKLNIKKFDCIKIKKNIKEQKFLDTLKERSENIKGAFEITDKDELKNKNILLIDDVYASGETLKEVINLFKSFGLHNHLECLIFCYRNHIFK